MAPGRRTVSAVLRILGRECDRDFCTFHRILNRAAWSSRVAARQLLIVLVKAFVPSGAPVVIGLDDTIERRWGAKISARGIYRDPVRSSKGHFVKASGLRWLSAMLLVKIPWADRIMALPFLTLLAPSKRFYADKTRAPKTLLDWARQAALQIHRWLPDRHVVLAADSAFAAIEFLAAVRNHVCVVTRWLLVRDPTGELEPQAFLATDLNARPGDILAWFVICGRPHGKHFLALRTIWSAAVICPASVCAEQMSAGPDEVRRQGSLSVGRALRS